MLYLWLIGTQEMERKHASFLADCPFREVYTLEKNKNEKFEIIGNITGDIKLENEFKL